MRNSSAKGLSEAAVLLGLVILWAGFAHVASDYVVTGPGPGPAVAPNTCPFVFLDANVKYAAGFCSSSECSFHPLLFGTRFGQRV